MITNEIKQYVQNQIDSAQQDARYSTKNAAAHTHNGIDSPRLSNSDLVAGVSQIIAGVNVTISPAGGTGVVTVNATGATGGVISLTAGTGISISSSTGSVTVTNIGVTSLIAASGITLTNSTGAVSISANGGGVSYSSVISTRNLSTPSGSETIPHLLGKKPAFVRADANLATGNAIGHSRGAYDGTTQNYAQLGWVNTGSSGASSQGTNSIIQLYGDSGSNGQIASITVDATNINVTWTKVGAGSGSFGVLWECEG